MKVIAILKMRKRLKEEDFAVLRGSLEIGRQSPGNISFVLYKSFNFNERGLFVFQ